MKLYIFVLFLPLTFLFAGCPPRCEYQSDCENTYIGTIRLNDSTKSWVPYLGGSSFTLKNQNGTSAIFITNNVVVDTNKIYHGAIKEWKCIEPCTFYYHVESESFKFKSTNTPTEIIIKRTKNINGKINPATPESVSKDKLIIKINNHSFHFKLNNDSIYSSNVYDYSSYDYEINGSEFTTEFFSSIQLGGKTFSNIYKCYRDYFNNPDAVYYSRTLGLVAYRVLNQELWVLQ